MENLDGFNHSCKEMYTDLAILSNFLYTILLLSGIPFITLQACLLNTVRITPFTPDRMTSLPKMSDLPDFAIS